MKETMKNISKGAALLCMSTLPLFGALHEDQGSSEHESDCSCCQKCCPPKDPCANCAQLWPSGGPETIVTPNAGPCVDNSCNMFLTAEFIYWVIRQDHMGFCFFE